MQFVSQRSHQSVNHLKLNGIEPFSWLTDALTSIKDHPVNRIDELLPVVGYQPGVV